MVLRSKVTRMGSARSTELTIMSTNYSQQVCQRTGPKTVKTKKTHGLNSHIVISIYPKIYRRLKKATEYRNN